MIVIGLKGLIGSGKTTVARHLIENHGFVRGRFAGALKDMLRAYLRYRRCDEATIERMIDGDLKEQPSPGWAASRPGTPWKVSAAFGVAITWARTSGSGPRPTCST
ncbi:hypothetical protein [Bradyrhizobium barranii]